MNVAYNLKRINLECILGIEKLLLYNKNENFDFNSTNKTIYKSN